MLLVPLTIQGRQCFCASHAIRILVRCRQSRASDLPSAEKWRKTNLGITGPLSTVQSPESVAGLRRRLAAAKEGSVLVRELQREPSASMPDFAKAVQRSGELRDYGTLCAIMRLQHDRQLECSRQQYGILFTALARVSWGEDGRGTCASDKKRALDYGKVLWQHMQTHDVLREQPVYGGALSLCAKAGDCAWARQIWEEMHYRQMTPDAPSRCHYLSALAKHGGQSGWETVYSEVSLMKHSGDTFTEPVLAVLLNAAGEQHDLARTEHVWQELAPLIPEQTSVVYCVKAKALLLCEAVAAVPPLRNEMRRKNIQPNFRMFKNEAQAHLLMLHQVPGSNSHAENLAEVVRLAQLQRGQQPVSRNEVRELVRMQDLGSRIVNGERLQKAEVRVEQWAWPD